ncbi:MAG: hypothetical protein AAB512_04165 [Patescibacteria group bacterium]
MPDDEKKDELTTPEAGSNTPPSAEQLDAGQTAARQTEDAARKASEAGGLEQGLKSVASAGDAGQEGNGGNIAPEQPGPRVPIEPGESLTTEEYFDSVSKAPNTDALLAKMPPGLRAGYDRYTAEHPIEPRDGLNRLGDGSVDYGDGVIGPSAEDIARAKGPPVESGAGAKEILNQGAEELRRREAAAGGGEPPVDVPPVAAADNDGNGNETDGATPPVEKMSRYTVADSNESIARDMVRRHDAGEDADPNDGFLELPLEKKAYVISDLYGLYLERGVDDKDHKEFLDDIREGFEDEIAALPDGDEKTRYEQEMADWDKYLRVEGTASPDTGGASENVDQAKGIRDSLDAGMDPEELRRTIAGNPEAAAILDSVLAERGAAPPAPDASTPETPEPARPSAPTPEPAAPSRADTLRARAADSLSEEELAYMRLADMKPKALARELRRKQARLKTLERLLDRTADDTKAAEYAEKAGKLEDEIDFIKQVMEDEGVDADEAGNGGTSNKSEKQTEAARKLEEKMDDYRRFGESTFDELKKTEDKEQGVLKGLRESFSRAKSKEERDLINSKIAEAEARLAVIKSFKAEKEVGHLEDKNDEAIKETQLRRRELGETAYLEGNIKNNKTALEALDKDILAIEEKILKEREGSEEWKRLNHQKLELSKRANKMRETLRLDEDALEVAKEKAKKDVKLRSTWENIDQKSPEEYRAMSREEQIKYLDEVAKVLPEGKRYNFDNLNGRAMAGQPLSIEERAYLQNEISHRLLAGTYDAKCITKLVQYPEIADGVIEKFMYHKSLEKWRRENCPNGWEKVIDLAKKYPALFAILAALMAAGVTASGGGIPALGFASMGAKKGIFG